MTNTRPRLRDLVVADISGDEARIVGGYGTRLIIKALPKYARRWDPDRGAWIVRAEFVDRLVRALVNDGFEVDVYCGDQVVTHK